MQELVQVESLIVSPPRIPFVISSKQTEYLVSYPTPRAVERGNMDIFVFDGLRLCQGTTHVSTNDRCSFFSVMFRANPSRRRRKQMGRILHDQVGSTPRHV